MKYQAIIAAVLFICYFTSVQGQVTQPNNIPNVNNYVGFDGSSGDLLPIQNIGDPRINISSNGNDKMNFNELAIWNGLNGMTENDVSRIHLGLNGNFQNPFSMIHMGTNINNNLQRPWMNVGLTLGANLDILHMGLIQRPVPGGLDNQVDAVIAWGCNDDINAPGAGPDNFRFLFISPDPPFPVGSPSGDSNEEQGRETMRITPMGNVGIGDFSHMPNGLNEQPTERLDVDGTARLRQMPNNTPEVVITGIEADATGDYVLNYATFEEIGDELEIEIPCDWDVVGNDVAAGYPGGCVTDKILMGTNTDPGGNTKVFATKNDPGITMHVEAVDGSDVETAGYFIAANAEGTWANGVIGEAKNSRRNYGVDGYALHAGQINYGIRGNARDGKINYGGFGSATDAKTLNFGLYGVARGGTEAFVPINNVGVYGRAWGYSSIPTLVDIS